jgi:hypothetical protein
LIEFGVLWKVLEKSLGGVGGPLYERYQRYAARRDIRRSAGRKIAILLAKIDGDGNDSHRRTLAETIRREFGDAVEMTRWTTALPLIDGHEYDAERGAYATAQRWLREKRCDVLLAGREKGKNAAGETVLSLQFITAEHESEKTGSYKLSDTLDLPVGFVSDLGAAIAAHIMMSASVAVQMQGHFLVPPMRAAADRFGPIIRQLNPAFDSVTRGSLLHSYALICNAIGVQAGSSSELATAVDTYREALKEWTRERVPLDWATTQNNLGTALATLGERESGTARLDEAVEAFREALGVFEPVQASHYAQLARQNLTHVQELVAKRMTAAN